MIAAVNSNRSFNAPANVTSVIIGDESVRPILDVNVNADLESRLYVRIPGGPDLCVELVPSQTLILLSLASAWHEDAHFGATDDWRRGYRTYDELGEIYSKIKGDREAISSEAVRKYISQITTSIREEAKRKNLFIDVIREVLFVRRPRKGYQIGPDGIEIRGLGEPARGDQDLEVVASIS